MLPKLDKITFHAKIGTQGARAERISALAGEIAAELGANAAEVKQAARAGLLCKADLVTGMVGEFPELQGVMGGYYAAKDSDEGAAAIGGCDPHALPAKGPGDAVPRGMVAVSVALADKLDTLIEFFRIGEKPTGSGDPYALRRAALGVIRIILENDDLRLSLGCAGSPSCSLSFIERLRVKLRGEGRVSTFWTRCWPAAGMTICVDIMQPRERACAISSPRQMAPICSPPIAAPPTSCASKTPRTARMRASVQEDALIAGRASIASNSALRQVHGR